ncbi:MAG TPA: hypothetical protein VG734_10410 [Lacunisphaera sp.]|nr:hypothetical protein [Lacunisphaera sp.]
MALAADADKGAAAATAADRPKLQMKVVAPYVIDLIQRDEIVDALFSRVRDGIRARSRDLEIVQVEEGDEPAQGKPLLTLTLIDWRQTRMGDIECRFSAEYSSFDGKLALGIFDGVTPSIVRSRGFLGEDFVKAAEDAGRSLGEALRRQKLI